MFTVSHTGSIVSSVSFVFKMQIMHALHSRDETKILACEHLQNFCEHEQASTLQFEQRPNFASTFELDGTIRHPYKFLASFRKLRNCLFTYLTMHFDSCLQGSSTIGVTNTCNIYLPWVLLFYQVFSLLITVSVLWSGLISRFPETNLILAKFWAAVQTNSSKLKRITHWIPHWGDSAPK